MNKEDVLKLLAALGVKLGEGGMAEDDAVKLVEGQFEAVHRGLIKNRDDLLANEIKLKEKITGFESSGSESAKRIAELEAQVKKNNPEEYKKYYEGQAKELESKHKAAIDVLTSERDKYKNSHNERIKNDSINEAIKNLNFVDGLKDGFIALAMLKNQFKTSEIDGKTIFTNQDNKSIETVLHELSLSKEGKAYLKNGNQGAGSGGNNQSNQNSSGSVNGKTMPRSQFFAMTPKQQMEFATSGGQVTES